MKHFRLHAINVIVGRVRLPVEGWGTDDAFQTWMLDDGMIVEENGQMRLT